MKLRNKSLWLLLMAAGVCVFPAVLFASDGGAHGGGMSMTHRMMVLAIQFGVIIFAARFFNILFEKLRLPGVLGELCAGMVIGAYALGGVGFMGLENGLFPMFGSQPVWPELYALSSIAAIVLLFDVGLETDLKLLIRYSFAGSLVGFGGVAASFILGVLTAKFFAPNIIGREVGYFDPMCLFLGIASTATSVGITARILSEKRKLDSPEGVTILSAAVIDDVIGIIMLAIVIGVTAAQKKGGGELDWGHIGMIGTKAVSVWLITTVIGIAASRKISFLLKLFGERTSIAVMALGLALILSGLFEEAGLAMIIGAYVMGLSLSQSDISHVVREKIHPIYSLLVPVFFCVTGMMIDLSAMTSPAVLTFGAIYTVVALVSKVIGCGLPALLANFNLRGALRVGFGMAPRGEVGLIIATLGLGAGVLDQKMFAAVIIMVVINTVIAPPVLVGLFKSPKRGTRKEVESESDEKTLTFEFPSIEMVEFFVGKLNGVFESEGFYSHLLSRDQRLYQLRKDKDVIEFSYSGSVLEFNCHKQLVNYVNVAMYEALAALESAISQLRQPLDKIQISQGLQEGNGGDTHHKVLRQYIRPEFVSNLLTSNTKEGVIDELLDLLVRSGQIKSERLEEAKKAIWNREKSMSTGLQYGLAIPHGKTDAVSKLVCVVGVKPEGLDFQALDQKNSHIFILTLSPESSPAPHIKFMAAISHIFDASTLEKVLNCKTSHELCEVFTGPLVNAPKYRMFNRS